MRRQAPEDAARDATGNGSPEAARWIAERIDRVCMRFEDAWLGGERPSLEDALRGASDCPDGPLFLALLAVDLVYRRRAGDEPEPGAYGERFPRFLAEIDEAFGMFGGARNAADATFDEESSVREGARLGRYRVVRRLGQGAFGTVHLAEDEELDRRVAIKVAGDGRAPSGDQIARLFEEARAAARLRHPGIVMIHDVQPLGARSFFTVQEFVDGPTLRNALDGSRDPRELAALFARIADAVAFAHSEGFVHRDLNPRNILIDSHGQPRVTDFGLALQIDRQAEHAHERAGSWSYMSPEQVRGESHRLDGRADIWAIGVMLYQGLTGRRPFAAETTEQLADEILHRPPRPPRQFVAGIPAEIERACLKCLAKSPEDRFATAGDLANALRNALPDPSRRTARRALLAAAPLGLLAAYAAWRGTRRGADDGQALAFLDFSVWRRRAWRGLGDPDIVPLRAGDQVRLTIRCNPARYAYVVWIDARGTAAPVFPWRNGAWADHHRVAPASTLHLPEDDPDAVWTMEVHRPGCELLMLLTRDAPWSIESDRIPRALFTDLAIPPEPPPEAIRIDYDRIEPISIAGRGIDGAVRRIDDPIVRLQTELRRRLRDAFTVSQFLLLPVAPS